MEECHSEGCAIQPSVKVKESANAMDKADIRKYAAPSKTQTGGAKLKGKAATRCKDTGKESLVSTDQSQIQQSITDMLPVRRSTRKCKTVMESEECTIQPSVKIKESASAMDKADIRKYAAPSKTQTGGAKLKGKAATRCKDTGKESLVSTDRRQIQQSITDMLPVRRSTRKCKAVMETELFEETAKKLRCKVEADLEVKEVEDKGKGVFSTRPRKKGDFICEYSGELISYEEALSREKKYSNSPDTGCYMYYFEHKNTKYCIDATKDNGRMGRLLNHSKTQANVVTKLYEIDSHPYLCLMASRDIGLGEELQYDYGERNREAIEAHPWLST